MIEYEGIREDLLRRLGKLRAEVSELETAIRVIERLLIASRSEQSEDPTKLDTGTTMTEAIKRCLEDNGSYMTVAGIIETLKKSGYRSDVKDRNKYRTYVYNVLWRLRKGDHPTFVKKGDRWGLAHAEPISSIPSS